ncbi:SDR family oxidoreductase [Caulobacter sp. NIBR2454]|uniref:SDR family oxidoreductase n=1 Tax=Caulobacter sp. NIBR2454 TaxID=3015996 RepID=UPI0022B70833|nr:SDR family oxidoreductase [Caulobacter sp. NIBR2454]
MKLLTFGHGYTARALATRLSPSGWTTTAVARDAGKAADLRALGVEAVAGDDRPALVAALKGVSAILISAPPTAEGCPGLNTLVPALAEANAFPDWIGYLSTTGVYGDLGGGWAFETSPLPASSPEGARRVAAERDWMQVGRGMGLTVQAFRLPGIYGPRRSAFDRLRDGTARRMVKPGQVFSRIHVDDIAAALAASIERPRAGRRYNLCDDEPCPPQDVVTHAAKLLGVEPPPETLFDPEKLPPAALRFYAESKRVSNARAKAELGWLPQFPTYREGLAAILKAGG